MNKQFSIRESLKTAWGLIKNENMFLLIGLYLAYFIVSGIFSFITGVVTDPVLNPLLSIISYVLGIVFSLGFIKICLQIAQGEEPTFSSFTDVMPLILKYIFASVLVALPVLVSIGLMIVEPVKDTLSDPMQINESAQRLEAFVALFKGHERVTTIIGLILFLPSFYLMVRSYFFLYLIVDKKMGVIESIKSSWVMTKGNFWHLVVLFLVFVGLVIGGILALIIGFFVVLPWISMVVVVVYKKLITKLEKNEIAEPLF